MVALHPADYVVFVLLVFAPIAIGMLFACRGNKTTDDYLVGNRNLGLFPVALSFTASLYSSIAMIGIPADVYTSGVVSFYLVVAVLVGSVTASLIFIPVMYPLKLTSVNTYLKDRYNSTAISALGTASNIVSMVLMAGVVCLGPALAINAGTGFPVWASILLGNSLTILYTALGGIKAVIWTDVFQLFLMVIGVLAVCIQAILTIGDIELVAQVCEEHGRMNFKKFSTDPTVPLTFWTMSVGVGFLETLSCVLSAIPLMVVIVSLAVLSGMCMFAYYEIEGCDPLRGGVIQNANQMILFFVVTVANAPTIPGLLLAGITAASLSSASSLLNACAANLADDVLRKIWPKMSDKRLVLITKILVIVTGVLATAISFIVMDMGGSLLTIIIIFASAFITPIGVLFLLGLFCPFINWIGGFVGALLGLTFGIWISFGSILGKAGHHSAMPTTTTNCTNIGGVLLANFTSFPPIGTTQSSYFSLMDFNTPYPEDTGPVDKLYAISYQWIGLYSAFMAAVVAISISLLTGCSRGQEIQPKMVHPIVRRFIKSADRNAEPSSQELLEQKA